MARYRRRRRRGFRMIGRKRRKRTIRRYGSSRGGYRL